MIRLCLIGLFTLLLLPCLALAATDNDPFTANKDYEVISTPAAVNAIPNGKIQVIEFFNYGCPWCYHLESSLKQWLATKPKNVSFERVPVVFEPGWDIYAKAYYVAVRLGVEAKMTPVIFDAVQQQHLDIANSASLAKLFEQQGVKKAAFDSTYNFMPGIAGQMSRGEGLMNTYSVTEIPTLVINGKYKINNTMTGGDNQKLMATLNYLLQKELQAKPN